jgi:hypothetical protein
MFGITNSLFPFNKKAAAIPRSVGTTAAGGTAVKRQQQPN